MRARALRGRTAIVTMRAAAHAARRSLRVRRGARGATPRAFTAA